VLKKLSFLVPILTTFSLIMEPALMTAETDFILKTRSVNPAKILASHAPLLILAQDAKKALIFLQVIVFVTNSFLETIVSLTVEKDLPKHLLLYLLVFLV
jgi:hypothetical protein